MAAKLGMSTALGAMVLFVCWRLKEGVGFVVRCLPLVKGKNKRGNIQPSSLIWIL